MQGQSLKHMLAYLWLPHVLLSCGLLSSTSQYPKRGYSGLQMLSPTRIHLGKTSQLCMILCGPSMTAHSRTSRRQS